MDFKKAKRMCKWVILEAYVEGVVLGVTPDRWYWTLDGSGEFSVASARKVIDDNRFSEVSTQTRWIKAVPIKVNIHAWKVRMDCLPTRLNISQRDINADWETRYAKEGNEINSMMEVIRNYQEESFTHKEEMAPMALSDSEVTTCSKSCLKNYETLKKQYDDLRIDLNQSEFNLANYKRDASFNESEINALKIQIERLKKEKESNEFKIDNFENASKSLDKLIRNQIFDNNRKGVGYNALALAPPPTGLFVPPTIDLSSSGLEEFQQPEFEGYGLRANKSVCENSSNETKKNSDAPLIQEWVSDNEDEVESPVVVEKKTDVPTIPKVDVVRPKQQEKSVRKTVRYAEMYRSKGPRGNQRNWNNLKSQQLGSNFVMYNKACYVCGSFDHLQYTCKQKRQLNGQREEKPVWNNARRVNHQNSPRITHPNPKRHMVPRKILTRSGPISLNTARQSHFNAVRTNRVNAVKASACWVWRPIKPNSASITLKRYDYVDGNPEIELEDSVRLNSPEDKKSMTEDINADWETRYAKEGNEINIIDGVMICFKEKI
ncbi:hypothetical protein Tco_0640221 [Tanacetum coccineum]